VGAPAFWPLSAADPNQLAQTADKSARTVACVRACVCVCA
jgi:hypothetical protein